MPHVEGEVFRVYAEDEGSMDAARMASAVLHAEWPKYEPRFKKAMAQLMLKSIGMGLDVSDEDILAAVRQVLPPRL